MFTTISEPKIAPIPKPPKPSKKSAPTGSVYAVIDIEVSGDYRPSNADSSPCEDLGSWPADLVCKVAAMFNEHQNSAKNRKWACVGLNGAMFYLCNLAIEDRPADPTSFPPGAMMGLTYDEAMWHQEQQNNERIKLARVPRRWTVALRPLAVVEGGAE